MGNYDALRAALLKNQIDVPDYQAAVPGAQMQDADAGFSGYGPPLPTDATDPTNTILDSIAQKNKYAPTTTLSGGAGDVGANIASMGGGVAKPQNAAQIEDDVNHRFAVNAALNDTDSPPQGSPQSPPNPSPQTPSPMANPADPQNKAKFAALAEMIGRGGQQ